MAFSVILGIIIVFNIIGIVENFRISKIYDKRIDKLSEELASKYVELSKIRELPLG